MRTDSATPKRAGGPLLLTDSAIGAAIRSRRGEVQQGEVARRAGLNLSVYSRIERGERPCRVSEMVSIAKALNTPEDEMLKLIREHVAEQEAVKSLRKSNG
ncbi:MULTISPECIES: helix-turn-helix domain-containing protein [Mycobacteroides]|uniref:DNA-binding protein n=2 Tax=Mycobacteroides TaxID=670516 RepID=A0ABR5LM60_9MYCO|nr:MULTISPECIES: helix-turn-helix transcriptional regulator [Mycobacteroides]AKP58791.1 DNA-binding protein [Mycobacteroides abscessus UC22]AMU75852.1 DNA-binding protein [Mycobacteroides abscessus]ANO24797.1 DNA-binding protein [Mycobacteroides abscessus]KPG28076.1 DNA-binding protein [Mycobacteroides immunogenum]KPG28768.1 DNA-binding protein [Mycobacteroides immunogenum]